MNQKHKYILIGVVSVVIAGVAGKYFMNAHEANMLAANAEHCNKDPNPDSRIAGCSALIDNVQMSPENLAKAHNNRGMAYNGKEQFDNALVDLNAAIAIEPNYANAYLNQGLSYLGKENFDKALASFDKALALGSDFRGHLGRGAAYDGKKMYDKAIAEFSEVIKEKPNFAIAYNSRSIVKEHKGDSKGAKEDLAKAKELGIDNIKM